MARLFDDSSSQYLEVGAAPVTTEPFSMGCWFYADDVSNTLTLLSLSKAGSNTGFNRLFVHGTAGGDPIGAQTQIAGGAGGTNFATTSTGITINTFHHALGVFAAQNDRKVYLDGGSKGTSSYDPGSTWVEDTWSVGRNAGLSFAYEYFSGRIAEVGLWNVALTDAEAAALGKGFSPLFIRPQSLIFYAPLIGKNSPEIDLVGGFNMTLSNSPTTSSHPRIIYPTSKQIRWFSAVAAGANTRRYSLPLTGIG